MTFYSSAGFSITAFVITTEQMQADSQVVYTVLTFLYLLFIKTVFTLV